MQTNEQQPVITIAHVLPGRMRLRLSLHPRDTADMAAQVQEHEGIEQIDYTPVTRSVLVRFDPQVVTKEELIVRFGVVLSLDYGKLPVLVVARPPVRELSDSALYSGMGVLVALLARLFRVNPGQTTMLDGLAGAGVGGAVLEHGWREIKTKGIFDPEVLSVTYLMMAMLRGKILPGALFTWIASFGRHLINAPTNAYELKPIKGNGDSRRLEMLITPKIYNPHQRTILNLVPSLVEYALTGGKGPSVQFMDELRQVSQLHDKVLHGLGQYRNGIPLVFE